MDSTTQASTPLSKDEKSHFNAILKDLPMLAVRGSGRGSRAETVADVVAQYEYMGAVLRQYLKQNDELRDELDAIKRDLDATGRVLRRIMGTDSATAKDAFKAIYAAMAIRHEFTLNDLKDMASDHGVEL